MAHPGAIAHSRPHLSPRASVLSLSSSVSPLRPSSLGLLGRGGPRSCTSLFVRRYGQPSSSSLARRACVHVLPFSSPGIAVHGYKFSSNSSTGSSRISIALLFSPEAEGDGNGGRLVRSPCPPSWRGLRLYVVHQMLSILTFVSLCCLYSDCPLSSRPQPLGGVGDDTPFEDTREDFGLSV